MPQPKESSTKFCAALTAPLAVQEWAMLGTSCILGQVVAAPPNEEIINVIANRAILAEADASVSEACTLI